MRLFSAVLLVTSLVGCGGAAGPQLFPISGKLTVSGKPVAGVGVQLIPVAAKTASLSASGTTDAEGAFTLKAINGDPGAPKGKYKVVLSYSPASTLSAEEQSKAAATGRPPAATTPPFPKEWMAPETSPKEYEVTDKPQPLDLSL